MSIGCRRCWGGNTSVLAEVGLCCQTSRRSQWSTLMHNESSVCLHPSGAGKLTITVDFVHVFSWYATDDALLDDLGILPDHMLHNLKILHRDLLSSAIAPSPLRPSSCGGHRSPEAERLPCSPIAPPCPPLDQPGHHIQLRPS